MPRKTTTKKKPNRTARLPDVRLYPAERSEILHKADVSWHKSYAEFVRQTLLHAGGGGHKKATNRETIEAFLKLGAELSRSGNNLNQIAKKLNAGRRVRPDYFDEVLTKHMQVLETLEEMALGMMHDT